MVMGSYSPDISFHVTAWPRSDAGPIPYCGDVHGVDMLDGPDGVGHSLNERLGCRIGEGGHPAG